MASIYLELPTIGQWRHRFVQGSVSKRQTIDRSVVFCGCGPNLKALAIGQYPSACIRHAPGGHTNDLEILNRLIDLLFVNHHGISSLKSPGPKPSKIKLEKRRESVRVKFWWLRLRHRHAVNGAPDGQRDHAPRRSHLRQPYWVRQRHPGQWRRQSLV